jgi:hypothetical protein
MLNGGMARDICEPQVRAGPLPGNVGMATAEIAGSARTASNVAIPSLPDAVQTTNWSLATGLRDFHPEKTATGLPSRETLEISEFFRSLLRSDTQAGPTGRCPPDGYEIADPRFAMQ